MIDHEDGMSGNDVDRSKVDCCILKTVTAINQKLACNSAISFGSADINKPGGFVITEPGIYCLKEDVVFSPRMSTIAPATPPLPVALGGTGPNYDPLAPTTVQAAITIRSSNVVLDLGDHRLSQAGAGTSTQVPYVVGIVIPDMIPNDPDINAVGLESIYIKGGDPAIIDGFSMWGIRIFAHTYDIRLSNITIKNCAELASLGLRPTVYGFPYVPHDDPTAPGFGPSFTVGGLAICEMAAFGFGPVWFADLPDLQLNAVNRVNQVTLENVSCLNNFLVGLRAPSTSNVTINSSHFNETWSDDPGDTVNFTYPALSPFGATFTSVGQNPFVPQTANIDPSLYNAVISNSTFNDTTYRGDFTTILDVAFPVAGCTTTHSKNVVWNNCQFNGTTCTFVNVSATNVAAACGFLSSGIEDNTFNNCHFDNVTALGTINGFHMSGTQAVPPPPFPGITFKSSRNVSLINCTSNNHQSIGDQRLPVPTLPLGPDTVTGFAIFYVKDLVMDGCISQDLVTKGPNNLLSTNVTGFLIAAEAAQLPPLPDATVQNVTFRNCVASRCFALNGGAVGGWNLQTASAPIGIDAQKAVVLENCIASCNQTFTPTLTTPGIVQGPAFGFIVLEATVITPEEFEGVPTVFQGCKALHNKGLPVSPSGTIRYTSGFYISRDVRSSLIDCDAIDNIYGFFFNNAGRCTVRNCRSDNNVDLQFVPGTGEGFTAVVTGGTPAAPGVTTNVFQNNSAFANGGNVAHTGLNANYNVLVGAGITPPILGITNSTAVIFGPINPAVYYANLHNISTIS